jgi:hypothetical protein
LSDGLGPVVEELVKDRKVFETFRELGTFGRQQLTQDEPSCFNGVVRVEKYRVTVEKVEEPPEVIEERLQKLWAENTNHHNYGPLEAMANRLGVKLRPRA